MTQHNRQGNARWTGDQNATLLSVLMRWNTRCAHKERMVCERAWQRWGEYDALRRGEVGEERLANLKAAALQLLQQKSPNNRSDNDCKVIGKWRSEEHTSE